MYLKHLLLPPFWFSSGTPAMYICVCVCVFYLLISLRTSEGLFFSIRFSVLLISILCRCCAVSLLPLSFSTEAALTCGNSASELRVLPLSSELHVLPLSSELHVLPVLV